MVENPRFLVIGCGSIGQRHIGNLLALGVKDVLVYDVRPDRREQTVNRFGVTAVNTLEDGWHTRPDVALVAAPTSLHLSLALEGAHHGCHLFIEKPLGHELEGIEELLAEVSKRDLVTLVGCNTRFHHGPATMKKLLDKGAVGRIIAAHLDAGSYLPEWHPWEDYRQMYSARASLGGGIILDGIHEIDYARWLMGPVVTVYAKGGKLSSLEIDTEDTADILMTTVAGFSVSIHMDYVQRVYGRSCKIIGDEGTICWDINDGDVRLFSARDKCWHSFPPPPDYSVNRMYLDEMSHFLRCLAGDEECALAVGEASKVLEIALAAKESIQSGQARTLVP